MLFMKLDVLVNQHFEHLLDAIEPAFLIPVDFVAH